MARIPTGTTGKERAKKKRTKCETKALSKVQLQVAWPGAERSLDTVVRAASAAVLPVWVDFTSLKGRAGPR